MIIKQIDELEGRSKEVALFFKDLILDKLPVGDAWIAGGAIRKAFNEENNLTSDIDLYFPTEKFRLESQRFLESKGFVVDYENQNATRLFDGDMDYDLIKLLYPSISKTIENFDFTVCCCAISRNLMIYHDDYFDHLKNKVIMLNNYKIDPISILPRLQRYIMKGYFCPEKVLLNITEELSGKKIGDWSTLTPHIISTPKQSPVNVWWTNNNLNNNYEINSSFAVNTAATIVNVTTEF